MVEIVFFIFGCGALFMGVKGFTREGIQIGKEQFITGLTAKAIGFVCFIMGLAAIAVVVLYTIQKFGANTDDYGRW